MSRVTSASVRCDLPRSWSLALRFGISFQDFCFVPFSEAGVSGVTSRNVEVFTIKCLPIGSICPENETEKGQYEHRARGSVPQGQNRVYGADLSGFLPAVPVPFQSVFRWVQGEGHQGQSKAENRSPWAPYKRHSAGTGREGPGAESHRCRGPLGGCGLRSRCDLDHSAIPFFPNNLIRPLGR